MNRRGGPVAGLLPDAHGPGKTAALELEAG